MTIQEIIETLKDMGDQVGYDQEVPVMLTFGENDYIVPSFGIVADLRDQDGREFKCALIGGEGGSELTKKGIFHWNWKPSEDRI